MVHHGFLQKLNKGYIWITTFRRGTVYTMKESYIALINHSIRNNSERHSCKPEVPVNCI